MSIAATFLFPVLADLSYDAMFGVFAALRLAQCAAQLAVYAWRHWYLGKLFPKERRLQKQLSFIEKELISVIW